MPTIQLSPGDGNDDADQTDDGSNFAVGGATLICQNNSFNGIRDRVGIRFPNCTVPKNAVITAATLEVRVSAIDDPDNLTIAANNVDNANNFVTEASVITRALTTASVAWPGTNIGTNAYKTSPSLVTVVQEIVNRAGWASGNAICIILRGRAGGTTGLSFSAFETGPTQIPLLNITYASSGGGSSGGQGKGGGGGVPGGGGGIGKDKDKGGGKGPPGIIDRYLVGSRRRTRIGVL